VMMPRMDGLTLCETLKTDDRTSHIPIILLTAKATIASRLEGLEKGADAYLAKPFQREELLLRLDKLVELRKRLQKHFNATGTLLEAIRDNKEPTPDQRFVQTLLRLIKQRLDDPDLSVVDLCRAVKRSNTQVNRKLKALTGKTPSQFIRFVRLQHALELLKTSDLNISEIAYQVGFSNANYFSRAFSEEFGTAPSGVRK
ncbi:MAG: DNA-binding response regulator, partial [Bacteroidota bacterium]